MINEGKYFGPPSEVLRRVDAWFESQKREIGGILLRIEKASESHTFKRVYRHWRVYDANISNGNKYHYIGLMLTGEKGSIHGRFVDEDERKIFKINEGNEAEIGKILFLKIREREEKTQKKESKASRKTTSSPKSEKKGKKNKRFHL